MVEASVCVKEREHRRFEPIFFDIARRPGPPGPPGSNPNTDGTNAGSYCTLIEEPVSVLLYVKSSDHKMFVC